MPRSAFIETESFIITSVPETQKAQVASPWVWRFQTVRLGLIRMRLEKRW
jgi:hypothetical protein